MIEVSDRPLLTFALFAYNQEPYIREAVEGAFSQTYRPLEIILSDDCSRDRTFEVLKSMASAYRGPHRLRLNQNPANLGVGDHVNRLMELAEGDFIIAAGGDDISLPNRAAATAEAWRAHPSACSIYGTYETFGEADYVLPPFKARPELHTAASMLPFAGAKIPGCSHAWHKRVFTLFGPIPPGVLAEDRVIPFRSSLIGEVVFIDERLVRYRCHSKAVSSAYRGGTAGTRREIHRRRLLRQTLRLNLLRSHQSDIEKACGTGLITPARAAELSDIIRVTRAYEQRVKDTLDAAYPRRVWASLQLLADPVPSRPGSFRSRLGTFIRTLAPFLNG